MMSASLSIVIHTRALSSQNKERVRVREGPFDINKWLLVSLTVYLETGLTPKVRLGG